jgi:hypothetical protein
VEDALTAWKDKHFFFTIQKKCTTMEESNNDKIQCLFSSYPALNFRSDLFFTLQKIAQQTGCKYLNDAINEPYFEVTNTGHRCFTDLKKRDQIVVNIYIELRNAPSKYRINLDQYDELKALCVAYVSLIGVTNRVRNDVANSIKNLLFLTGGYLTPEQAEAIGREKYDNFISNFKNNNR